MKIGFQGIKGAYSEAAIYKHFGRENIEPIGFTTFEDVFEALDEHKINLAMLPIENSIVGSVSINMDLLYKHDFFVIGEEYLPIQHCLLANAHTDLDKIQYVYSHPVALDQCRSFLKKHGIKPIATYDTAGAAKMIGEKRAINEASISSSLCCDYYDLKVLNENVQDTPNNFTRFFVFSHSDSIPTDLFMEKTTLAFSVKHHPGALLNCLSKFAQKRINLTKLESRPIPHNPFEYTFFVDLIGSLNSEDIQECLVELKHDTHNIKIIGSYPISSLEG